MVEGKDLIVIVVEEEVVFVMVVVALGRSPSLAHFLLLLFLLSLPPSLLLHSPLYLPEHSYCLQTMMTSILY